MKYLLSLPANASANFVPSDSADRNDWFATSDPQGSRLGSGAGTTWLLEAYYRSEKEVNDFEEWLSHDKRILIHGGGQSRRLPSYAVTGKIALPIPIFRWARGQKLSQNLLSLQLPLYDKIMQQAPQNINTLIASGDVYIQAGDFLPEIPDADVICYGLWVDASLATRHGVFASKRTSPESLDFVLQKPSAEKLEALSHTHFFLMDIGVWLLSDKAVSILRSKSYDEQGEIAFYDLYSDFGMAMGNTPTKADDEIGELKVKVLPLTDAEFYHFGTSREMISSTLSLQQKVHDQRLIMHKKIKPNSSIFTQNAEVNISFTPQNHNIWIENSYIGKGWEVTKDNVLSGVPQNDWAIRLNKGICIDIVPISLNEFALRPYGIDDTFSGDIHSDGTVWMGNPLQQWLKKRHISSDSISGKSNDLQNALLFPVMHNKTDMEKVLKWMLYPDSTPEGKEIWENQRRISAEELMNEGSLQRIRAQRDSLMKMNYKQLEINYEKSVFYQIDLSETARYYHKFRLPLPSPLKSGSDEMLHIHNRMLRSAIMSLNGEKKEATQEESKAFAMLRKGMTDTLTQNKRSPRLSVYADQIVWGRSPVRIDLAGGWTDTPPYSMFTGGNVVNAAIELNGQPPLQVYIRPLAEPHIVLRSIDMGDREVVDTFEELRDYKKIGSPFSIPKAALALSGFLPEFSNDNHSTLKEQLSAFGAGIELTLLAAIPAGSGLGTSSILASTVLGALNDFCALQWNKHEICTYTLVLEQLLTTGGGWQDQYGGIFHGIKLLQSQSGFVQSPQISWLPEHLFKDPLYQPCHLLYYTGITRVAKNILDEIVRGMFLNSSRHLDILAEMKMHAIDMAAHIQKGDFEKFGRLIGKTWKQKQTIDTGTNPSEVQNIIAQIKDYTVGHKLPGAGGGGYLYMVAKDSEAASRIKMTLTKNPPNGKARFVEMALSDKGFQVSRS